LGMEGKGKKRKEGRDECMGAWEDIRTRGYSYSERLGNGEGE
jgi:hypothetical protein